jgi:hypothetical protein
MKRYIFGALALVAALSLLVIVGHTQGSWWQPSGLINWQWQLTTPVDLSINAQVYDIDGFENDASVVSAIHAKGAKAICYIDLGTWENWRPDQASFPASVKGASNGWPGEVWLDIRQISVLSPIMIARLQMCKSKGFDAVEPDNIDGYANSTGFPLTAADQLTYNKWIADQVHALGMSAGLKNDLDQVPQLVSKFDWVLDEQCHQYSECSALDPFVSAGKTVFVTEYTAFNASTCTSSNSAGYSTIFKDLNLTAPVHSCVSGSPPPPTDTTAPTVPSGLSASAASASSIGLSWSASSDAVGVVGYRIKRGATVVGTASGTSFTDTGLSAATSYTYSVAAYDAAGNVSAYSSTASATTSASASVPQILAFSASPVTLVAGSATTLSWNTTGATTLSISGLGTVTGTSRSVSPATTTTYVLTATNASGSTSASVTVSVTTTGGGSGLPTISSFSASPNSITSGQSSTLSWSVSGTGTTNTHRFLIYYGTPQGVNGLWSTNAAAAVFANYDTVVFGDGLEDPANVNHATTAAVISAMKTLKPAIKIYGYVDLGVTTQNLSIPTITTKISQWHTTGATGIFFDDAGYDFHTLRSRQNQAIDAAHTASMQVIENAFTAADALGSSVDVTYNPAGTATHLTTGDGYLLESWVVNSAAYSGAGGWETVLDIKTRGDAAQTYRASLGIKVYAEGSADWTTVSASTQALYFSTLQALAAIYSWDGYGLNTYQFSAAVPNQDIVKTQPYSTAFNAAYSPGASFTYTSGTQTFTRATITVVYGATPAVTFPSSTVSIDQSVGTQTGSSVAVSPTVTTTYTLTATNSVGSVTATVKVTVDASPVPIIATFTASPSSVPAGSRATLSWSILNATSVSINNGVGTVTGSTSKVVTPSVTTVYTITATNGSGSSTATVTVHVFVVGGPGTPKPGRWPGAACTDADLYHAADHAGSNLATAISATDTSLSLTATSTFVVHQIARIDSELMQVCGISGTTLTICSGTRGFAGTAATAHDAGAYVTGPVASVYHNQLVTEIIALEASLYGHAGTTPSGTSIGGSSWPNHAVTIDELLNATDAAQSLLASSVTASATTLPLSVAGNFVPHQIIGIEFELIRTCSVPNGTALAVCANGRGFAGTVAATHNAGASVVGVYAAYLHNRLAIELSAIEQDLFGTLGGGTAGAGVSWPNHAVTTTELLVAAHGSITADYHNRIAQEMIALEANLFGRVP